MIVIFKHIYRWLTDKNYRWWSKYSSPRFMYMYYDKFLKPKEDEK